jgi:hypothetical protein
VDHVPLLVRLDEQGVEHLLLALIAKMGGVILPSAVIADRDIPGDNVIIYKFKICFCKYLNYVQMCGYKSLDEKISGFKKIKILIKSWRNVF